jgi:hypothetical protein
VAYSVHGTGNASLPQANQVIVLLILDDHDLTAVSDRAVERHQSRTTDLPPARQTSLPDRDWHKCRGTISVDTWAVPAIITQFAEARLLIW